MLVLRCVCVCAEIKVKIELSAVGIRFIVIRHALCLILCYSALSSLCLQLTVLQAKVHYLRYLSELQPYGGREFKSILLVSFCHFVCGRYKRWLLVYVCYLYIFLASGRYKLVILVDGC